MNITLSRYRKQADHIDGRLKTDQGILCDTVENAETAIPVGTYQISIIKCKQHSRKKPVIIVKKVPECKKCTLMECVNNNTSMPLYCPQITCGNGMHNRKDGAIIVGTLSCSGCLIHPKTAFDKVYDILRKNAERGHEITLTVVEHYPKPTPRELTPYMMGTRILKQF